jgi:YHS domain-containing protein
MTFFRFILLAGIIAILVKWLWPDGTPKKKRPSLRRSAPAVEEMQRDPICGTYVPASLAITLTRGKDTYYFCSGDCRDKFNENTKTS